MIKFYDITSIFRKTVKNKYCLLSFLILNFLGLQAQVSVSATLGTASTSYTKLSSAFTAINSGTHKGVITISITANITETASATLNASGSGSCNYTSINISPSGGARTVSGSVTGQLIYFYSADNVTIDGLNSGGNSLTFNNTLSSASTIVFINGASNNTIKNCNIYSAYSASLSSGGCIFFSIDIGSIGSDNNLISNNNIGGIGGNYPSVCIANLGSYNTENTIKDNNIFDYYSKTSSAAIYLALGAQNWTITNNKFYQTTSKRIISGTHYIIFGSTGANSENNIISYNTFGYSNSSGTGTYSLYGNSSTLSSFPTSYTITSADTMKSFTLSCIEFSSSKSNGIASNIVGNKFSNFALLSSSGTSIMSPIVITGNNAVVKDNIIGDTSGNGSIYIATSTSGGRIRGIYATTSDSCTIMNNYIGSIEASGTSATNTCPAFTGIEIAGTGKHLVSNNYIGSSSASNIRTGLYLNGANLTNSNGTATSVSGTQTNYGINSTGTGANINIQNNTIKGFATSGATQAYTFINSSGTMASAASKININNNYLGTASTDLVNFAVANSGALTGISMTNTIATTHNIKNNDIRGITYSAAGSGPNTYIKFTGGTTANNISTIDGNTFTNLNVNTTGSINFISHNYLFISATGTININNNAIVTAFNKGGAGGTVNGLYSSGIANTGAITNHTNNNFSNITVTGPTIVNGILNTEGSTTIFPRRIVSGNTFSNWTGGSGTITAINYSSGGGNSTLANNTVNTITGQAAITGINLCGGGNGVSSMDMNNNIVTNLTSNGTGGNVTGINSSNSSVLTNIFNNTIKTYSSTGASSTVAGITIDGGANTNVYSNIINTLSGSGATTPIINGIQASSGTTISIFKNKIYDLSQSGAISSAITPGVNGINISNGTTVNAFNNLIGDLKSPNANQAEAIRGIAVPSNITNTNYNLYNNTIYITGTSSGTNFGVTGIYHTSSATATTAALTLNNNLIVVNATLKGTGIVVPLKRSSSTTVNFVSSSNNNLYYGTSGIYNGTTHATLAAYQATVSPIDASSKTESSFNASTYFQSTTGSDALYLKPNASTTGNASGTAATLSAGFTDDYAGTPRTTTWDIGAWEFSKSNPAITFLSVSPTFSGQCTATARTIKAIIKAVSGSLSTTTLNYSYNAVAQSPITMTNTSGDTFSATIPLPTTTTDSIFWNIFVENSISKDSTYVGTSYADKKSISTMAYIPSSNISGAVEQCTDGSGWTYYAHPSTPDQWLFGIKKNGNSFTATVDIGFNSTPYYAVSSNGANREHASSIMGRYWNVNTSNTSFPNSMSIRFFHSADEYFATDDSLTNKFNTLKNSTNPNTTAKQSGTMEWFKTVGTAYNPSNWVGNIYGGTIIKLNFVASGTYNGYDYSELDGITSFSGGSVGTSFGAGTGTLNKGGGLSAVGLPVTWNEIKALPIAIGNEISWSTESEKNTRSFDVEYSYDGIHFNSCKEIINAAGNSISKTQYQYIHKNEYHDLVYYRIKQEDNENNFSYSKTVFVMRSNEIIFEASIYPTILKSEDLKIDIKSNTAQNTMIKIYDLYSKEVSSYSLEYQGIYTSKNIDLKHLSSGSYFVKMDNGEQSVIKKLIISK